MIDELKAKLLKNQQTVLGQKMMKKYAILVPIVKKDDGLYILFEKRAHTLRRQPGEISFPGGKIENNDETPMEAAIRETSEELGIKKENIDIIGELGVMVPFRKSLIYPFVANILTQDFKPNPDEVDYEFLVPLDFLLQNEPAIHKIKLSVKPDKTFPYHLIPGGENYPWRFSYVDEHFYQYGEHVIWGMTANVLYNFILTIK